jgi:UDP-N-acetylglucosamine 2-epimerase (non-hydrolysing)
LLNMLSGVSRDLPLAWPVQPALAEQLKRHRMDRFIVAERILLLPVRPYPDYLRILRSATCVLTDSWTVQEEAMILNVPCLTIGRHPERPLTTTLGSNVNVGMSSTALTRAVWECIFNGGKRAHLPELWDGRAGARIAKYLCAWLPAATSGARSLA